MRNLSLLLGLVLLVHGVFGVDEVKSVSVMVGDSLTLNTDFTETKGDELHWKIEGESDVIAQIDREANKITVPGNNEERYRDRLKLDHQTGSLTITNIRTTDSGVYELKIKDSMNDNKYRFIVTVRDVFFVDTDGVKSVSVTEGDNVTLHTGVTDIQRDDQKLWKFGDQDLNSPVDTRWSNIDQNDQTRDLNIKNIRIDQSGDYKMEIKTSSMILHRKFYIAVGGVKTVSVKEGDPVNLHTSVIEIKGFDQILWKTKGDLVAEINQVTNLFLLNDNGDVRFNGRLDLDRQTGDLTISDSETTDSGVYHLNMISSSHTVQRNISVTVKDSDLSSGAIAGIAAGVLLVVFAVAAGMIYLCWENSKLKKRLRNAEKNETDDSLNLRES